MSMLADSFFFVSPVFDFRFVISPFFASLPAADALLLLLLRCECVCACVCVCVCVCVLCARVLCYVRGCVDAR